MSGIDEAELAWWRESFVPCFRTGNLPHVGEPRYGQRYVLMDDTAGERLRIHRCSHHRRQEPCP